LTTSVRMPATIFLSASELDVSKSTREGER
jgi:hypothetical protein